MPPSARSASSIIRFGVFELDFESLELRKNGRKLKIEGQPVHLLRCLLEHPGHVVSREELQQKLWPSDTFVDFEHGLNSAIKRLRQALDDSADTPRFVETLPRRGYRFIYPITTSPLPAPAPRGLAANRWIGGMALLGVATLAIVFFGLQRARPAGPSLTAIAVLPLENLTGAPDQEYLVDGLHDEVITELAQISALKVTSRTSVLRYKRQKKPLRQIATELGVDSVLEGAVRRDGERWHVTAQLISARDDHHVWAQSYEGPLRELAAVPRAIARGVTTRLHVPLRPQEEATLAKIQTLDPALLRAFFKAIYYADQSTVESLQKAVAHFREALDLDPTFARAWSGLGYAYEALGEWGGSGDDGGESNTELRRLAEAAYMRAVKLDDTLLGPHQALGRMKFAEWDWEGGSREFERARELDPSHPGFGNYLLTLGKFDEAVEVRRQVAQRDPLSYFTQLIFGWTAFMAGRYDEAIVQLRKTIALNPKLPHAHFELAWCYVKKHRYQEAIEECETSLKLLRRTKPNAFVAQGCEWVYAMAGRRQEALDLVHQIEVADDDRAFTRRAHVYDALGDRERALFYLQKAYEQKAGSLPRQWYVPMLSDDIKADPRFQELIRRTGHPWARFPTKRSVPSDGKTRAGGQ